MKILVFNCGSSSLKYRLIEMPSETELASGEAQRIGASTAARARIVHRGAGGEKTEFHEMRDHAQAFGKIMRLLEGCSLGPDAMAHRLVHGGDLFVAPALIGAEELDALKETCPLAPLHNPPAIALIETCRRLHPRLPQAAVFDTAYHATIPPHAREYTLPRRLSAELGIRKYGFHGSSHEFVAEEAARFLNRPLSRFNAVSCHLGSGGASLCAVREGKSIDNTMGYSPLQGLVMSTRCGDLDPAVVMNLLAENLGNGRAVEKILNQSSGVLGLSGHSSDIRDVLAPPADFPGSVARLEAAARVYLWRIRKYLGAYLTAVGRTDAVIFTDTIGETVGTVRWAVCSGMEFFGLRLDSKANYSGRPAPLVISRADSAVKVLVIKTNEELAIARRAFRSVLRNAAGRKNACTP